MVWREMPGMLKEAFKDWNEDNAPRLGAALAYYTIFSIAPLLLISIAIAGMAFGQEAAQGQIVSQIEGLVGRQAAESIQEMIENSRKPEQGAMATVFGTAMLLFGAGGAFNQLRGAFDIIWEIPQKEGGGLKALIRDRLFSFAMVLVVGFLLLVSLVISAGISALELRGTFPGSGVVLQVANNAISLGVITVLFALIFKYLPDATPAIAWKDIWMGAFFTSFLFTLGKFGLGLYLGRGTVGSAFGAAGSLVLLLVWIYYSAQILFFGAELTQVYARRHGSRMGVARAAETTKAAERARGREEVKEEEGETVAARVARARKDRSRPQTARDIQPALTAPPSGAVGKGLAWSVALLLLGYINKKKGWPTT